MSLDDDFCTECGYHIDCCQCASASRSPAMAGYTWGTNKAGIIKSPFNMEEILRACPGLYAKWKEHPFIFDLNEGGHVVCVYV